MTMSKLMRNTVVDRVTASRQLPVVHVAVGVILKNNQVCITKRHAHLHQGDKWEFPGGKVEAGESVFAALQRELFEEIDIQVTAAEPLLNITFHYSDKSVLLDVWQVNAFDGTACGKEGQDLMWSPVETLVAADFPAANRAIIHALTLAPFYVISPECDNSQSFLSALETTLKNGYRLIQLRCKSVRDEMFLALAGEATRLAHAYNAKILLNADPQDVIATGADGVHLSSQRLLQLTTRPLASQKWVAASVHNKQELQQAINIHADFVVVSPVLPTLSHPGATPLGWEGLQAIIEQSPIPVYALGGMTRASRQQARSVGALGVAGIREFWG